MSTRPPGRLNRRTTRRLLRGAPVCRAGAVADLLAAAAAPGREDELAGEPAALAAFRSARLEPVPRPRRRPVIASALTAKIAAVTVAALAFGGIATAAVTGHLATHPGPVLKVAPAGGHSATAGRTSTTRQATAGGALPASGSGGHHGSPVPNLAGLCHAYRNAGGAGHSPAFAALVDAAGGAARVPAYCATLAHGRSGKSAQTQPKGHDRPAHPTAPQPTVPHPTVPQPTVPQPTVPQPTVPQPTVAPPHATGHPAHGRHGH